MTEKRQSYDLKFKQNVIKYAEENSNREAGRKFSIDESMFVDGERNRLKSAINLPLKAKRENCLVESGNHFMETKFFCNYFIPDFNSLFRKINAASIQGRLLIIF